MNPAPSTAAETEDVVEAIDLTRRFSGMVAVSGMSLTLGAGEMLGLIGPNGAGKTTMFNMIAGSLRPSAGQLLISGHDVTTAPPEDRIGYGLARTFQIPRPFSEMTLIDNLLVGGQAQVGESLIANFLRPGIVCAQERRLREKARSILDFVTLSHLETQPARVLSGGQRKLLELARVLMADPRVILLDEPAAGVNPSLLEVIISRIVELNRSGTAILLIEHNMDMVSRLCSRVIAMAGGKHLAEGSPADVAANPDVIEAYLGGTP
ncbi:ABC transporter ATP-binding protein [Allorhizobium taibaishanense]|uniref:ABC transporter ATP-binding protein n=1 Tax=Allorhizobium taibaishanense TaxID=887144 RepID=A0A1Q9AA25_9HYPH|nr:ABC transporter ATP-binding protein [Allorhizobium taibaishanense]MBB4010050.1 branched-chain amino acid transport system ATP-binding protein [Allorhizobium taibaishanense]OLP51658.1 ABC transporter ATP-binding protein [Allorhizobium taibaishanense]